MNDERPGDIECGFGQFDEPSFDHVSGLPVGPIGLAGHRLLCGEDGQALFDRLGPAHDPFEIVVGNRHAR